MSRTPPRPGMFPESLTLAALLNADSARSPISPARVRMIPSQMAEAKLKIRIPEKLRDNPGIEIRMSADNIAVAKPPPSPSQLFLGLNDGANL